MWQELIYLGPAPAHEPCVSVGDPDYATKALAECRAYIEAIRKVVGEEPDGAALRVGDRWLVVTTDSHVVHPIFCPGGDIGRISVTRRNETNSQSRERDCFECFERDDPR